MNIVKFSEDMLITKMLSGSHAYGTAIATSDVDYRGIFVAPSICCRTPFFKINEQTDTSEEDTKYYELNKFMELALDCNPNIIELLWTDMTDVVLDTPAYQILRKAAPLLLSSKVAFTFSGYAMSQLKRIKGHNKWINNPQNENPPQQVDFISLVHNFTDDKLFKINLREYENNHRLIPYDTNTFGVYKETGATTFNSKTGVLNGEHMPKIGTPEFIIKYNQQEYVNAHEMWKNYWTWKAERNKTRSELEEKYGFDSKHAMHLVRLLRMGKEILNSGLVFVKRPDAEDLLDIRNGKWTYDEIIKYAEDMDDNIRNNLYQKTDLPKKPNINLAAQLILDIQDLAWTK